MTSKKILSTVLITSMPFFVFSQNTFTNDGTNVGIGTTTPAERLEVVTSGSSNLQLSNSGNVFGAVGALKFSMAGTHVGGIEMERTISAGTLSAMKFLVRYGSGVTGEFMRITQDQRLGIGTNSPNVKVSIYGPNDNDAAISLQSAVNSRFYIQQGGQYLKLGGTAPNGDGAINISNNGSVAIGTTTAGSYKLAVKGSIGAMRVKVSQADWADFVFEPEYHLPSLTDMEAYIKEHRHLPDVPSAKEVSAKGLDLGEMNKILLQKIEELTLHLIEQDKMLRTQKEQINQLTKSLNENR
ncbi:hypothetical protein [Chitinophaga sp. S165]|uniref:hypothetical protein n=1 Tax=Chitinophaga sp. S165 TaxID=2135462 RepID=UPI000D9348CE|nr:hypothetical protein [Chitinophaga sp. S165]PWV56391.1 hypothetical protein C7475_101906 [Chitinophaga sp. S165]